MQCKYCGQDTQSSEPICCECQNILRVEKKSSTLYFYVIFVLGFVVPTAITSICNIYMQRDLWGMRYGVLITLKECFFLCLIIHIYGYLFAPY